MSDKKLKFFGWCREEINGKLTHDKIWGIISADGEWVTFWGRRDKTLAFKRGRDYPNLDKTIREKLDKDYRETSMEEMTALDSEFETRFEEALLLCLLGNRFHQNPYLEK